MKSDDFGAVLLGTPPLEKAASFFIRIKTAGWTDPPDETGELEGQFAAPVEQVIHACGGVAKMLMELKIAFEVYEASIRGPEDNSAIRHGRWDAETFLSYLMKRMSILGGPVHLEPPEMPPATTDFLDATKILLRKEQEILAATTSLKELIGCENPMGGALQRHCEAGQERIDDLWKVLPRENAPVLEGGAPPHDELGEAHEETEGLHDESLEGLPEEKVAKAEEAFQKALKQRGMDRAVSSRAAKTEREKSQRGERFGKAIGALVGGVGGAAAGRKFIGGKAGTIAGLAGGMMTGGTAGREVGKEVDIKKTSANRFLGAGLGAAAGAGAGYLAAPGGDKMLGAVVGGGGAGYSLQQGVRALRLERAAEADAVKHMARRQEKDRMLDTLAQASAAKAAKRKELRALGIPEIVGEGASIKTSSVQQLHFATALQKMAEGVDGGLGEAPMAPPASSNESPQEAATAYLQAENTAREAQEQNEMTHYKQRFQAAVQENQGLQQMMQQTQQQLMQVQQQAQEAQAQIEQTTQQAVQANDVATQQSQQAAQMRMGMQQMRAQMLQVASQEPDAIAQQMQQEQAQAQAQQLSTELQPPAEEGQQQEEGVPATPQKAEQEAVEAQKAQGQADQQAQQAQQAAVGAQQKMGSVAAHTAIGAALGAAAPLSLARGGEKGLQTQRDRISGLEGKGGFANAMRMARAKAHLATSEVAVKHPVASALTGAASGAMIGNQFGREFPGYASEAIQGARNVGKHGIKSLFR